MTATNKARKRGRRAKVRKVKAWAIMLKGDATIIWGINGPIMYPTKAVAKFRCKNNGHRPVPTRVVPCEISYQVKA